MNRFKFTAVYVLIICTAILMSCGSTMKGLSEPAESGNLLIGCLLFENVGFQTIFELVTEGIEVGIIGKYMEDGKEKTFGKWLETDEEGYFFLSNVPDGRYAIKAIRVYIAGQQRFTISNDWIRPISNFKIQSSELVVFEGNAFKLKQKNRIINLKYNYFSIYTNGEIQAGRFDVVEDLKLSTGDMLNRPFIFDYFIEKYPQSAWVPFLQKEKAETF